PMGRRLTPIARWSIHSTGLAGSSRAPTSRISLSSRLMTIPSCIRRRCSRAPFLLRGVSPRGRRTAEQRDEQQPLEWSGERYVPSHRIFAADAGAHHGRTPQAAPLLELAERAKRVSVPLRCPSWRALPSARRRGAAAKSRLAPAASYRRRSPD